MVFEQAVFSWHTEGRLDLKVLESFLPEGNIRENEGPMWDYKTGYIRPVAQVDSEEYFLCECLKDIVGFHNNHGGYIIYAFRDDLASHFRRLMNNDLFNSLCDKYLRSYISIGCFNWKGVVNGDHGNVSLFHISKRSKEKPPLAFIKNSAESKSGKLCFRANEIFFRHGSTTLPINNRYDLIVYSFGERRAEIGEVPSQLQEIDNNLPPRDPNLIEFIGRREYLVNLWGWLSDLRNPVRVLTALGGTGKTAIAYEFCEQIVKSRTAAFSKVIWLTAKSQTYAAILQKYVSTTRTDFTDVNSFLDALLREVGCLESDFQDFQSVDEKLDFAREVIKDIPVLVIIDDLDSLDNEQQIDLYSRIAQLFDQASSGHAKSRVIFTSRLEPNAGPNRLMKVSGFGIEEMKDYIRSVVRHLGGEHSWGSHVRDNIEALWDASKGSPIFVASIIRIVSFGEALDSVLENWKGQDGEVVRRFAFEREISSLTYSDWRALYVLQMLASSTFEELKDLLSEDRLRLQASLMRLSQFHMFAGGANPSTGTQISVPEPIRLMIKITEEKLRSDDADELRKRCARVNQQASGDSDLSRALRGISLLWRRGHNQDALNEARRTVISNPKSGDASFFLGRAYLAVSNPDFEAADDAFAEALHKRCERADLYEYWSLSKLKRNDLSGLLRITAQSASGRSKSGITLLYRMAGMYRIARNQEDRRDFEAAIESYTRLQKEISSAIRSGSTEPVTTEISRLGVEVANYRVDIANSTYVLQVPERVFHLVVESCEDGLIPLRSVAPAVRNLTNYILDMAKKHRLKSRSRNHFERLRNQVKYVKQRVAKDNNSRHRAIAELERAEEVLRRVLSGSLR